MSGHTPGPWRAGFASEKDRRREMIVRAEEGDDQPYIAIFPGFTTDEHEANAQLCAAAPDLLAACEHLVNVVDDPTSELKSLCDAIAQAKAAVIKAKGGPP